MIQDPRVAATLWPGPLGGPRTAAQTRARLDEHIAHWEQHGFGLWMFCDRTTGAGVGYAGPRHTTVEQHAEVEIAYAVASARWGRGLATEMARAAVEATRAAGVDDLVCFTLVENAASRRVMEKAGFRYERDFERAGLAHALYRLPSGWQPVGRHG